MKPYIELLQAGKFPPSKAFIYLLLGPDATIHQDVAGRLTRGLVQSPELNYLHVRGSESTRADDIEAFGEEYPMMSRKRLVWIDGCDRLSAAVRASLAKYLPSRNLSTVMVLSSGQAGGKKAGPRKKEAEASPEDVAAELGVSIQCEFRVPRTPWDKGPDDRVAWVTLELEKRGMSGAVDARQALAGRLGNTLSELRNELDKLQAYLGTRHQFTRADVEAVVSRSVSGSMPELSTLLQKRQADPLLRLYHELLRGGAAPFQVLGYVAAILRPNASTAMLRAIMEAEVSAKSGTDPALAIELLLLQVCQDLRSPDPPMMRPRR